MKNYTKTTTETRPRLIITYDENGWNPREDSNLGYFITKDRYYQSPDDHGDFMEIMEEMGEIATDQKNHIDLMKKEIKNRLNTKVLAIYPVVKYEHSGICYSLGEKHGFDYSNNGFYIITKESQEEMGTPKKYFEKVIKEEIEMYNKYVNGETYRFTLFNEDGELEDQCSGYYNIEDIKSELPKDWQKENMEDYFIN